MWNQALTAEEVDAIYQDGLNGVGLDGAARGPALDITLSPDGTQLILDWESSDGKLYNLRSETDPSKGDPGDWPIHGGNEDIAALPPLNTLTIPLPADPRRFFVIEEFNAPPVAVFFDNFENGQGAWEVGSEGAAGTAWELGIPSNVGPATANSPDNCFGTNIAAEYELDAEVWLRSPAIDLTNAGGATLRYFQAADIEAIFDSGRVAVLDASDNSEIAVLDSAVEGASNAWREIVHVLPPAALGTTIRIEFRFFSDDFGVFAGWYLDDVTVTVP